MRVKAYAKAILTALILAMASPAVAQDIQPANVPKVVREADYRLGAGDKLRMIVFGEDTLTGEYLVSSGGKLALPLIGEVDARDRTVGDLQRDITERYKDGYLRQPSVSLEVLSYRPFYILGEVNKPGEYPYTADLTISKAVATAAGYTYRANTRRVYIKHAGENRERVYEADALLPIAPGDVIRIAERRF